MILAIPPGTYTATDVSFHEKYLDRMKTIALSMVLFMMAVAFSGCTGDGITGEWYGKAETENFTLTVELTIYPNSTADYDIIKLRKKETGLSEFYGTLNWTIDENNRIVLYETGIENTYRVLEKENGTLKWGTLYKGLDYIPLTKSWE